MREIINDIIEHGFTSNTLDAYFEKLKTALDDAYSAAAADNELASMVHLGEAVTTLEHMRAIWDKMNQKS